MNISPYLESGKMKRVGEDKVGKKNTGSRNGCLGIYSDGGVVGAEHLG